MTANRIINVLLRIGAAFLFCWIAFFNGFPVLYSDTGTYLESGFTLETPLDRPITYGFLLRIFSLNGLTIWTVVLAQAYLLSYLIWLTLREFVDTERNLRIIFSIVATVLALFTGMSIVASELIADIFTSMTLLCLFLLLFGKKTSKTESIILHVLFLLCAACHISHVLVSIAVILLVGVIYFVRRKKQKPTYLNRYAITAVLGISVIAYLVMMSSISKSRHVFMMGHLVETGILNAYLDDNCATKEISLCKFRDRIPSDAETFIWNKDGDSVIILTGGWLGTKEEYSSIISETFTNGRYLMMHIGAAFSGTIRQLYHVRCSEGIGKYDSTMLATQRLQKYFPGEFSAYSTSRQSEDYLAALPVLELFNIISLSVSLGITLLWLLIRRATTVAEIRLKIFVSLIFAMYLFNAAFCSMFAIVANRFSSRISWLIVILAVLVIADWIQNSKTKHLA
jgi:hypothetical protein